MRIKGWERRLIRAMEGQRELPFMWGASDCGHLMGAAIEACLGRHPILDILGRYNDKLSALKVISAYGGTSELLARFFEPIHPILARTGDVGTISDGSKEAGCVVCDGMAECKDDNGTYRVPVLSMTTAFRVG